MPEQITITVPNLEANRLTAPLTQEWLDNIGTRVEAPRIRTDTTWVRAIQDNLRDTWIDTVRSVYAEATASEIIAAGEERTGATVRGEIIHSLFEHEYGNIEAPNRLIEFGENISAMRPTTLYYTIDGRVLFAGYFTGSELALYELWPNKRLYKGELSLATPIYVQATLIIRGYGHVIDLLTVFNVCETPEDVRVVFSYLLYYSRRVRGDINRSNTLINGFKRPYTLLKAPGIGVGRLLQEPLPGDRHAEDIRAFIRESGVFTSKIYMTTINEKLYQVRCGEEDIPLYGTSFGTYVAIMHARTCKGIDYIEGPHTHDEYDKLMYSRDGIILEEFWMAKGPHTPQKIYDDIKGRYFSEENGYHLIWNAKDGYLIQRIGLHREDDQLWEPWEVPSL